MSEYYLKDQVFTIENYDKKAPFSSFLPGLAGVLGIPLWVFYTNRGQGINSFGIHNKNNAIMEFHPANTAYENTGLKGFRTFIRCEKDYFEPFLTYGENTKRDLFIKKNSFTIVEENKEHEILTKVSYFVLPNEDTGALVRRVSVRNQGTKKKSLEMIDGLAKIIPYGIGNGAYKEMSNLLKSWTEIKNIENMAPYYTMRSSSDDSAKVEEIEGGYFYLSVKDGKLLPVLYDRDVLFGYDTSLQNPVVFWEADLEEVLKRQQHFANKVPCGFTPIKTELNEGEEVSFDTFIGFCGSVKQLNAKIPIFCKEGYARKKEEETDSVLEQFVKDVQTKTAKPVFDEYISQCYLDNFLRGGYPFVFDKRENPLVVHLFSRKHGDPERDYNFFSLAGEYYSQGNGNFRDVCQNRRNDVFFHPEIGSFNIYSFFSLVQIDGYNPLEIRPSTFTIRKEHQKEVEDLLGEEIEGETRNLHDLLTGHFTPGQISNTIAREQLRLLQKEENFIGKILSFSEEHLEAGFGEGYWSDHFDYLLDLVENYLMVFPDKKRELLFKDDSYRYYDSAVWIQKREKTYVRKDGAVRQYGAVIRDEKKASMPGFDERGTNWKKTVDGTFVTSTLFEKMVSLALTKFTLLDPYGMGIEMEGGKPGWNDAMNGLPGLFGSGISETVELTRILQFLVNTLQEMQEEELTISLPEETADFLFAVVASLKTWKESQKADADFIYWDEVANLRENFRDRTRFSLSGKKSSMTGKALLSILEAFLDKTQKGIQKAFVLGDGMMPTYFTYEAVEYESIPDVQKTEKVKVKKFDLKMVPAFLEGPARVLSMWKEKEEKKARVMYEKLLHSDLYDKKLGMYKTSGSLEEISMEHGRIRAFTPGWLERESIFLHMEYKYFLGLLKAGLYEEFYDTMKKALIPFLNPEQYGRSILENSSFLASSINPDPDVHGRGFVARLSGSTVEMLSMWIMMFTGGTLFRKERGQLVFGLSPKLPGWLFNEEGEASFSILSSCQVVYKNQKRKETYGEKGGKIARMELYFVDGKEKKIEGDLLFEEDARAVREGRVSLIQAFIE